MRREETRSYPALVEQWDEALAFLEGLLEEVEASPKAQMQLLIAIEELFVNVAHYAYTETDVPQKERTVRLDVIIEDGAEGRVATVTLTDGGIPYDPLAKPDPDITLSAEERQIGGLGIYMVKKSMDDMRYVYQDGQNVLTVIKKL